MKVHFTFYRPGCLRIPALVALGWLVTILHPVPAQSQVYSNTTPIIISAGEANPYPSTITVADTTGSIARVTVTLFNVVHIRSDDLDIVLKGPGGQTVMLMSDAGGDNRIPGVDLTFDQGAEAGLPESDQISGGVYRPTDYPPADVLPPPAPAGPYPTDLKVFNGADPNGIWQLFVFDDTSFTGGGEILEGWELRLDLAHPLVITEHPQDQTVSPGGTATFSVGVSGTPPFGYQWRRNGQVIEPFDLGGPSLTLTNAQAADAGHYSVVVTNASSPAGVASSNAFLNVTGPLMLIEAPQNQTVDPGETVQLQVTASGDPPLFYQWLLNGAVLPDETNSTLTLNNVQATSGGAFSVTVLNNNEGFTTEPAVLVVNAATDPPPEDDFDRRPRLQGLQGVVQEDSSRATSSSNEPVFTGGGRTVWCEWTAPEDGIATFAAQGSAFDTLLGVFTGSSSSNLALVTMDDDGGGFHTSRVQFNAQKGTSYQIMLDGFDFEGTGGMFTLSWLLQPTAELVPVIASPPVSQAVLAGSNATFEVISDTPDVSYQWFFDGNPIPDATDPKLTVIKAEPDDVGTYSVRLTSSSGLTQQSPQAELQIGTTPDALMHYKYQNVSQSSANGNRPGAGFVSIGIGVTDLLLAPITNSVASNTPCQEPFLSEYKYRGLEATNSGVIFVTTEGSEVFARLAVYREPIFLYTNSLDCDITSAPSLQPATLYFQATNGHSYKIVIESYQGTGDVHLTSTMGIAPDIPDAPEFCLIPPGGTLQLDVPATTWVPVPACQWRLNGQNLPGATNTSLVVTNFSLMHTGAYSVVMSNFVRTATNTVAIVGLAGPLTLEPLLTTNNGVVDLLITISNAAPFLLETKTNLDPNIPWLPLATNLEACQTFLHTSTNVLADPARFFRTVPWPPPEP